MDENKKRALDAAILKIEKDFGKGAVMRLGDSNAMGNMEVVPTGSLSLDIAETLVHSNAIDIIVIDSVAALVPKAEIDGEMGDAHHI